ncbi:hypothetical protein [Sanguibacter suarezii]|uniref:hypothetical protein n=1 Tax=Sanguibacter suarezii TaxID=60921 RepID=UPI000A98B5DF|nr:hypothetical protein [Sanguibacter suarezii]
MVGDFVDYRLGPASLANRHKATPTGGSETFAARSRSSLYPHGSAQVRDDQGPSGSGDEELSPGEGVEAPSPDARSAFDEARLYDSRSPVSTRAVIRDKKPKWLKRTHLDQVRAWLALGILIGVFVLYLIVFSAAIWGNMDMQMVQILATILSGPQALAATAVDFYYATRE